MVLKIFCITCNEHEFKIDDSIFKGSPVVTMKCPKCEHETVIYVNPDGELSIYRGKQ